MLGGFFSESVSVLLLEGGGSNAVQEVEDLHDVLVVQLGGELEEGSDKGLEEGALLVVAFSKLVNDLLVSGLDLGECNAVNHVLDELDSLFQGSNLYGEDVVLVSPLAVFRFSLGSAGLDGGDGLVVVFVGLFQISGGLDKDGGVFGDGDLQGCNSGNLFGNLLLEAGN